MAAVSLLVRFGLICLLVAASIQCAQAKDDKDDKGKWDNSPPKCPPPPCRRPPPPPPKCNPGCIPAPPPCRSKSCSGKCGHHCDCPPRKDSKAPPKKGSKRPPVKKDDGDLTDQDVSNLNDLLKLQFLLSNIYLKANSGLLKQQSSGPNKDEDQELVSRVFDQFSTTSIQQTRTLINGLSASTPMSDQYLNIPDLSGGVNQAFNGSLNPQFNAEASPMNMLLAVQSIGPSLLASVATNVLPNLESTSAITLVSSILPAAASQDSSLRTILFTQRDAVVDPYNLTVAEFMQKTRTMFRSMAGDEESDDQPGGDDNFLSIVGQTVGMSASSIINFLNGVLGLVGVGAPVRV